MMMTRMMLTIATEKWEADDWKRRLTEGTCHRHATVVTFCINSHVAVACVDILTCVNLNFDRQAHACSGAFDYKLNSHVDRQTFSRLKLFTLQPFVYYETLSNKRKILRRKFCHVCRNSAVTATKVTISCMQTHHHSW